MKVLVTGGTGHVGGEVGKELSKRNVDVRVLARDKAKQRLCRRKLKL